MFVCMYVFVCVHAYTLLVSLTSVFIILPVVTQVMLEEARLGQSRDGLCFSSSVLDNLFYHRLADATPQRNLHCRMKSVEEREKMAWERQRGGRWRRAR